MLKRQSQTTVHLRTPVTQMIIVNQGTMLLLGSNDFLRELQWYKGEVGQESWWSQVSGISLFAEFYTTHGMLYCRSSHIWTDIDILLLNQASRLRAVSRSWIVESPTVMDSIEILVIDGGSQQLIKTQFRVID